MSNLRFELLYTLSASTLERAHEVLLGAVENFPWPPVSGIESPVRAKPTKGTKPKEPSLAKLLEQPAPHIKVPANFTLHFGSASFLSFGHHPTSSEGVVSFALGDDLFREPADAIDRITWFVRRLLAQNALAAATMKRLGDAPGGCVPSVPLALRRTPLVVTTEAAIAEHYERSADFLSAGWRVERFGEQLLLTRLQSAITRAEVLAETRDHQWQMARAARPGRVRYEHPVIESDERELYEEGESKIEIVGVADGRAEVASSLLRGDHLPGFDVYRIAELVEQHRDVRVVFEDRWMAESEKRPLRDVGARVFYMDSETDADVEITD